MEQFVELQPETGPGKRARRPGTRRAATPAVERPARFIRSESRRGLAASGQPAGSRESGQTSHEERMTLGLRLSIAGAMLGMSLFFHAPLGAALASLLP